MKRTNQAATKMHDATIAAGEGARLLAAASSVYVPRLPLSQVLRYAAALMWDPRSQACSRLAMTLAIVNGYIQMQPGCRSGA